MPLGRSGALVASYEEGGPVQSNVFWLNAVETLPKTTRNRKIRPRKFKGIIKGMMKGLLRDNQYGIIKGQWLRDYEGTISKGLLRDND